MATQKQVFTEITESIDRCNHTLPGLIQFLKNGFQKLENASGGGGGGSTVEWTQIQATGTKIAEIEIDGDKTSVYAPTGATPTISVNAEDVAYSNTVSSLSATNVQDAIDEVSSKLDISDALFYENGTYSVSDGGITKANSSGTYVAIQLSIGKYVPTGKVVTINSCTINELNKYDGTSVSGSTGSATFNANYPNMVKVTATHSVTANNFYFVGATVNFTISDATP